MKLSALLLKLLTLPMIVVLLMACNLASAGIANSELIIIVTATPDDASSSLEAVSDLSDDDTTVSTISDTLTTTTSNAVNQAIPITDGVDNLYYAGSPMPAPADICYVYTAGAFNVNIRSGQSETAPILGQLRATQWIAVSHMMNGWFVIDMPGTPIDSSYISSSPTQLSPTCTCNSISCQIQANSGICNVSTHPDTRTFIHTEPGNWSKVVGELFEGATYSATTQSSSGWYLLESGGWVASNYLKLEPSVYCRSLPIIVFGPPILDCKLVNTTNAIATIYTEPNGEYYGRFGAGSSLDVIKRDGEWYQVYVAAFSSAGWVDGSMMTVSGNCL